MKGIILCPKLIDFRLECKNNLIKEGFNVFINQLKSLPNSLKYFEVDLRYYLKNNNKKKYF
jgi:hypothetical protein